MSSMLLATTQNLHLMALFIFHLLALLRLIRILEANCRSCSIFLLLSPSLRIILAMFISILSISCPFISSQLNYNIFTFIHAIYAASSLFHLFWFNPWYLSLLISCVDVSGSASSPSLSLLLNIFVPFFIILQCKIYYIWVKHYWKWSLCRICLR